MLAYTAAMFIVATGSIAFAQDREEAAPVHHAETSSAQDEESEEDDRMQEVVCRTERITGSLTRRGRICMTREEWGEVERAASQSHAEATRNASGSQCISDNPFSRDC